MKTLKTSIWRSVGTEKMQDETTRQIYEALKGRFPALPEAIEKVVYKRFERTASVRIIDPSFRGKRDEEREAMAMEALAPLGDAVTREIVLLLMYTPEEAKGELMNAEFENPGRTGLLPLKRRRKADRTEAKPSHN